MRFYLTLITITVLAFPAFAHPLPNGEARQVHYALAADDLNEDGVLSFDEWRPEESLDWFKEHATDEALKAVKERQKESFKKSDLNGDGRLDYSEVLANLTEYHNDHFDAHDLNRDDQVLIDEFSQMDDTFLYGYAMIWAFSEYGLAGEVETQEAREDAISALFASWGQENAKPYPAEIKRTNPIWVRIGIEFDELDLDSNSSISRQEFLQVKLGYFYKSDAAHVRNTVDSQTHDE